MTVNILTGLPFLELSQAKLGRFVRNIDDPTGNFHDPVKAPKDVAKSVVTNLSETQSSGSSGSVAADLTSLLSIALKRQERTSVRYTTKEAKFYSLDNSVPWFSDVVKLENTCRWIERAMKERGAKIYIVVGYRTLVDAEVTAINSDSSDSHGRLQFPVSVLAGGAPLPIADPAIEAFRGRSEENQSHYKAPGEKIYAVEYQRIRTAWFSSKIGNMKPKAKVWKSYAGTRGTDSDDEDMVEAELDDTAESDIDEREKYSTNSGEVFYSTLDEDEDEDEDE
ncbi:hypothetical protein DL95DRAFT_497413 [Leptodontidium sp. 2 PMI_412]|nr:hypothetical protein DL95DRAFT_497413 [Leptodontidium sp. 2 PMI_412]